MKHTVSELTGQKRLQRPLQEVLKKYRVDQNGCWIWTGRLHAHGYGRIIRNGVECRAHREQYFFHYPEADRSLVVRHRCDVRACINPAHLLIGTVRENVMDMHARGRFKGGAKPGNKNARGNNGWMKGGIVKMLGRIPATTPDTANPGDH